LGREKLGGRSGTFGKIRGGERRKGEMKEKEGLKENIFGALPIRKQISRAQKR